MSRKPLFPSANIRLDQVHDHDAISSTAESLLEINDTTKVSLISTGVVQSTSSEIQQIGMLHNHVYLFNVGKLTRCLVPSP